MLLTVACSLAAQSEDSGKKDFHKDLTKQKFNLRAGVKMPARLEMIAPEETGPCSIPLLRVTPPSRGTIRVIEPKGDSNMPQVRVPAPVCKDWPTE
ncbi:MAG: hypothetical protein JNK48_02445 [Bryobacterales bacterium]|nr:hypothetical protein [Bryobacterales bacterium]